MQTTNSIRRTRRATPETSTNYGLNAELESFLNVNASDAYKRPWHRLERGLRLNRIRNFVEAEKVRLNLSSEDTDYLRAKIDRALEKKLLNSKTCVVYDIEKEEIQEIKGLVYHRTADGRFLSSIIEKKVGSTFRKRVSKGETQGQGQGQGQQEQQNMKLESPPTVVPNEC